MPKFSKKVLLLAGASLGWAWTAPASAALPGFDRIDSVFSNHDNDLDVELVDYQTKMQRQQERECRAQDRERAKIIREQERMAKKASREQDRACKPPRPERCRDGADWSGMWDSSTSWTSDVSNYFTDDVGDPWTVSGAIADAMCVDEPCVNVGGWVQFGYTNHSDGAFNTRPNSFNNQQSWIFAEKVADGSKGLDFGGRIDALYGMDANNTQAFGNNPGRWDYQNGWDHGSFGYAIPQLYGTVAYENLSVKVGHFYTLHGYEVVAATGNFFYSHALTMNYMEPFTHTGAVGTYTVNEDIDIYAGWVAGWDTGFDQFNGSSAYTGGFKANLTDRMSMVFVQTFGNLGWIGDGYSQSLVVTTQLTDQLTSVIGGDIVHTNQQVLVGPATAPVTGGTFNGTSIYNYLIYSISDRTGIGMRNEWAKFDGVSYNSFTVGLNYRPFANLVIRPEFRRNYSPAGDNDKNNPLGIPVNQSIFGVDAVLTF